MKVKKNISLESTDEEKRQWVKEVAAELSGKTLFPEKVKRAKEYLKLVQLPPISKSK